MKRVRYGLRSPASADGRSGASLLIERMYAWRGYRGAGLEADDPHRITLTAADQGQVVGTLTIGIDAGIDAGTDAGIDAGINPGAGLMADHMYKDELDALRRDGARLCEVTRLAFDRSVQSRHALASVFHLAFIYAREMHGCTDAVIEVNPRHRRFYERMLGFRQLGDLKTNARVNAPSYLLHVSLAHVAQRVAQVGGAFSRGAGTPERSFYPYFFSPEEERGIVARLLQAGGTRASAG